MQIKTTILSDKLLSDNTSNQTQLRQTLTQPLTQRHLNAVLVEKQNLGKHNRGHNLVKTYCEKYNNHDKSVNRR